MLLTKWRWRVADWKERENKSSLSSKPLKMKQREINERRVHVIGG